MCIQTAWRGKLISDAGVHTKRKNSATLFALNSKNPSGTPSIGNQTIQLMHLL